MSGLRIAGVWEKTAPNGEVYYEGRWGTVIIRVYGNKYKRTEKDPDCVIYLNKVIDEKRATAPKKSPITPKKTGITPRPPEVRPPSAPFPQSRQTQPVSPEENDPPWPEGDNESEIPF